MGETVKSSEYHKNIQQIPLIIFGHTAINPTKYCPSPHTQQTHSVVESLVKIRDWNSMGFALLWTEIHFQTNVELCKMALFHSKTLWGDPRECAFRSIPIQSCCFLSPEAQRTGAPTFPNLAVSSAMKGDPPRVVGGGERGGGREWFSLPVRAFLVFISWSQPPIYKGNQSLKDSEVFFFKLRQ